MSEFFENKKHDLPDVSAFVETVKASDLFDKNAEIFIARAPGRLDVMGGIADYSGSLVLEMPIREAAFAALQKEDSRFIKIESLGAEENNRTHLFAMRLDDFISNGQIISYQKAQEKFKETAADSWAAYIVGAFLVLMREKNFQFKNGARILIDSKVPEGKGVSSSAALEVAVMNAVTAAFEIELNPRELAILCQKVENLVVGAPCGIMDQMSSSCGAENQLLSMVCQPAELGGTIQIPENLAVWGIDSGIRHSVGAGDYGSVRTGAFMGYRIIADLAKLKVQETDVSGVVNVEDERWKGYLANIDYEEFGRDFVQHLPMEISGEEFLNRYQGITDTVTKVLPEKTYAILKPTAHPVGENMRVHRFANLLKQPITEQSLAELGGLMYASHESYSHCGLGSEGTDLLVELVKRNSKKIFGAKITGGGSGGTVAVLGERGADDEIEKIAEIYEQKTGYRPYIFNGSSMGAAQFGFLKI